MDDLKKRFPFLKNADRWDVALIAAGIGMVVLWVILLLAILRRH